MAAPEARIAANRRNAAPSTGPRTAEGEQRSRRNALSPGLAASVVVPDEQAGAVALRVAMIQDSLAPDDDGLALILAERAGYLGRHRPGPGGGVGDDETAPLHSLSGPK